MINSEKSIVNKRFRQCYVEYFDYLVSYLILLFVNSFCYCINSFSLPLFILFILLDRLYSPLHSFLSFLHSFPPFLPSLSLSFSPPFLPSSLLIFPFIIISHHRAGVCLMSKFSKDFSSKSSVTTPSSLLLTLFLGMRFMLVVSSMGVYDDVSDRSYSERTDRNSSVQPVK